MRQTFLLVLVAGMLAIQAPLAGAQSCDGFRPQIGTVEAFVEGFSSPGEDPDPFDLDALPEGSEVSFEITVEDDEEVRSVSIELVHLDVQHAVLLPISILNKTVQPSGGEKETSIWTYGLPLERKDLVFGTYDVYIRAIDSSGCVASLPAAGDDPALSVTFIGEDATTGGDGDPLMWVPDPTDPSKAIKNPTTVGKSAATGGQAGTEITFAHPIVLKGDDRLRVFLDETRIKYPHQVTYEIDLGFGAFTEEQPFKHAVGLGSEILAEDAQAITIRYYSRETDKALDQFETDADNDGRLDFLPPAMVLRLEHVQVDRSEPYLIGIDTGTVFQGIPFDMTVSMADDTPVEGVVSFPGVVRGAQVRTGSPDQGLPLTPFRDAKVRYDDRGVVFDPNDRPFGSGDVLYLDTDGDSSVSVGDVVLSGVQASAVVPADYIDLGRTLIDPPEAFVDAYIDVDGDRAYGLGDVVVLDDPAGTGTDRGELSALDLYMSGRRQGQLATDLGTELRDGRLGIFAFQDQDGDGVFDHQEPVYYTGTSFVGAGDVRVANAILGKLERASADNGWLVERDANGHLRPSTSPDAGFMDLVFPFRIDQVGNHTYRLEVTDAVGNRHISQHVLTVAPPYTTMILQNTSVLSGPRLAGEPVQFQGSVMQEDGVAIIDVDVRFAADGVAQSLAASVPANGSALVSYNNTFRPGPHTMDITVIPPAVDVLNGSVLEAEVDFEVFLGKVVTPNATYWIRADGLGLPSKAVFDPEGDDKAYDLEQKSINGRLVRAFTVDGTELYWDPSLRNETGKAITEFEAMPATPTDGTDDSPLPIVVLLGAVAVALLRRR